MSTTVNIHQAKTHLSQLLEQVQQGEGVIIAKAGHPIARLVPYHAPRKRIAPPGRMRGQIWLADDFDKPLDDLFDCLQDEG